MDKDELNAWVLAKGWQIIGGWPTLAKPSAPREAIVRMVCKATVVQFEIRRPAGKWEKTSSQVYSLISADPDTGLPMGLGLESAPGLTMLMQQNKD